MQELAETGRFAVDPALRDALAKDFAAYYLDEDETRAAIRSLYGEYGYLCDPHTAVAAGALRKYRAATGDDRVTVVASTASPYKFAPAVCEALGMGTINDAYACIDALAEKTDCPCRRSSANCARSPTASRRSSTANRLPTRCARFCPNNPHPPPQSAAA